jgi:uncharacterized membrane protein HdeD (DUF308 family)
MVKAKRTRGARQRDDKVFGRNNWLILAVAVAVIILGFVALAYGSMTIAPIMLVLGYCVLLPLGIMVGKDKKSESEGG